MRFVPKLMNMVTTLNIPDAIYGIKPDLKVPKAFLVSHNENLNCIFLASCEANGFLYVNESLLEISGYSSETLIRGGLNWWFSLIHQDDMDQMLGIIFQHCFLKPSTKRLNEPFAVEYRIRKTNGSWIWIRETKCLISLTGEGKNELIIGRIEDITDLKRKEEIQLKQLLSSEGENNPLLRAAIPFISPDQNSKVNHISVQKRHAQREGLVMPTKRELEILKLIGEGYSTKQIAAKLYISINTVETHRRHLLEKIQVKNSMELIKQTTNAFWLKAI